jgi:hypothetical protein
MKSMNVRVIAVPTVILLIVIACRGGAPASPQDGTGSGTPAASSSVTGDVDAPATLTDVNLVATDVGGGVEALSAEWLYPAAYPDEHSAPELWRGGFGSSKTGRFLIDGLLEPTWLMGPDAPWTYTRTTWNPTSFPHEVVFSFHERQPALVGALVVVLPTPPKLAPREVEVWTSMDSPHEGFSRVVETTLAAEPGEQTVSFQAVSARFVKLRVLSGVGPSLEIAEVRVLEAARQGYVPLFDRVPGVKVWKGSPRDAAQRGLEWLQAAATEWSARNRCVGCHVQSQTLMGQAVALEQGYRVSLRAMTLLSDFTRSLSDGGNWGSRSSNQFAAMGLAYSADTVGNADNKELFAATDRLINGQAADGSLSLDPIHVPIVHGQFMPTGNALVAFRWAAARSKDPKYAQAADRAASWIAAAEPQTTQDKAFKIFSLMQHGTPDQKRIAWSAVEELAAEQQPDGGWKEAAARNGSNAFATGQALYAFKRAGVSIHGDMFRRGVEFLMRSQVNDPTPDNGMWNATNTQSDRPSAFAHTMWAVIGLAGSYGVEPTGALQIVKQQGDKPPTRNLQIVLDVSGSMNTKLGETTRWQTALDVLKQVVDQLPEDLHVGLRVYGHRYSSRSAQTCTDTQLVVPIGKLDRARILDTASKLRPRGETPLIRSVLQTIGDLKTAGGGSVILITDGEESCKGNPTAAAAELKASGLNLTLNIVGFTVTGQATEAALGALAGSTGGRYYSAQDGPQLSRAVLLAALHRLPYDILDEAGRVLVSGQTSELSRELPPGRYRIRIDALGQVLEEPLTILADQATSIALGVDGDRFVIRR